VPAINIKNLEAEKLQAEIKRIEAEALKLKVDATNPNQQWRRIWGKPGAIGVLLPGLAAIGTAYYAIDSGFIDAQREHLAATSERHSAEVTKLEAKEVALKSQLSSQETLQEAKRVKLTAEIIIFDNDQKKFSKRKIEFNKERTKLEGEAAHPKTTNFNLSSDNKKLENDVKNNREQVAQLKEERERLNKNLKNLISKVAALENNLQTSPVRITIDNILNKESDADLSFNAYYKLLLATLKKHPIKDNITIITNAVKRAKTPEVKALLYRTLYLALNEKNYLNKFIQISKTNWTLLNTYPNR